MKIRFSCSQCKNEFEKTKEELNTDKIGFRYCAYCITKLQVSNLNDIVKEDIKKQIENNVTKYYKEMGLEATSELIVRLGEGRIKDLYQEELRKRGLLK